jgi:hypothetical protein
MKKLTTLFAVGVILLSTVIIFSGCKKKSSPITPSFTVTATNVTFQDGSAGLQFYAKCTNTDCKMTKVTINDPIGASTTTFDLNGEYEVSGEIFGLQATNTGYTKELGTWTFNFVGNLTSDGSSFSAGGSLLVSGK